MKTCGIDLKGNEAILVCLEGNTKHHRLIGEETKKIALKNSSSQKDVLTFHQEILSFLTQYGIEKVGIKERATKGKFAGGSVSFKMEGLIQNTPFDVTILHPRTVKSGLKEVRPSAEIKVNQYQKDALSIALYMLVA